MKSYIRWGLVIIALGSLLEAVPRQASAQLQEMPQRQRFQIAGFAGYQWGGSFETDAFGTIPAGSLKLDGAANWGGIISFLAEPYTAVELWYLRQVDNVAFQPIAGIKQDVTNGGFASNYIHIGGRQEFPTGSSFHPFINGSLGITIFDPAASTLGSSTRFSFALGGGAQYMMGAAQRFGVRADVRWWVTPVPSGDYGVWCSYWSCYAAQGTDWISQGQVSGGIVVGF